MRLGNQITTSAILILALLFFDGLSDQVTAQVSEWSYTDNHTVIKMTVTPADEPVPALKHQLVLRPHQMRDGNAATHYLRAYPEGGVDKHLEHWKKKCGNEIYDWHSPDDFPLDDLPEDAKQMANDFNNETENYFEPASRCRTADWGHDLSHLNGLEDHLIPFARGSVGARYFSRAYAPKRVLPYLKSGLKMPSI